MVEDKIYINEIKEEIKKLKIEIIEKQDQLDDLLDALNNYNKELDEETEF